MTRRAPGLRLAVALAAIVLVPGTAQPSGPANSPPFAYTIEEGHNLNAFLRDGPAAAHLLLRSGRNPRLIVAFPAGNSGTGLWFAPVSQDARWRIDTAPAAATARDSAGRPLYGIAVAASIAVPELQLGEAALSSVRVLRDYELTGRQPAEVTATPVFGANGVAWERNRLDGAAGYRLSLEVRAGRLDGRRILAGPDGQIALRIIALSGERPLTPLTGADLLTTRAAADPAARRTLEFLSYREKFLAGSWRFNTYFGRDTLMSVRLLMPVLQPQAVEAGLGSVLARLSPEGDVAHEEDIGEFAVLDHLRKDGTRSDAPVYDYKMIDGAPMLAAVAAHWLLDDPRSRARSPAFLAGSATAERSNGAALVANLERVIAMGEGFAADPRAANLVALKPGLNVGNWRDSEDGLGGGRYPYDVNAVLMPAALAAAARLEASGLLDSWLSPAARVRMRHAAGMAEIWKLRAPPLFDYAIAGPAAERAIRTAALEAGVSPQPALGLLPKGTLRFPALALDAGGQPIAIMNSDVGFALLFSRPTAPELDRIAALITKPYPAGLMTDAGMLVANPAFASAGLQSRFSRNAYHGTVVWSWQQALALAGLERQLARKDLPATTRVALIEARRKLSLAVDANRGWRNSELWSWTVKSGSIRPHAFGSSTGDADESNAAQLWSSAFLAAR